MSRGPDLAILTALLSRNQGEHLSALGSLKNEVVGHFQKKEKWIKDGVLEPVVKVLSTSRSAAKSSRRDSRGHIQSASRTLTGEETVRLQALQILASFANGTIINPLTDMSPGR